MTRAELYALVWETPMLHLAKRFGLSDVGLRKICTKHDIPTPPLGYWAKRAHGKRVHQPPLPPLRADISDHVVLSERASRPMPAPVAAAHAAAAAAEASPDSKIRIPTERPARLHPIALEVGKALRKSRTDSAGMVTFIGGYWPVVQVGPASIARVETLLDTLATALARRGHALVRNDQSVRIVVENIPFELRIYETKSKTPHTPTKEDLARKARYDDDHRRLPRLYPADRKAWPNYDYRPSGKLALELTDPSGYRWGKENLVGRWYDRTNVPLGDMLGEVMVALATGAAAAKVRRAEEQEQARIAAEAAERRQQEEARRERAEKRLKFLNALADEYATYTKLAVFAPLILDMAREAGTEPIDRLGRVLRATLAEAGRRFERGTLNTEIERLALFGEGDPA